MSAPVIDKQVRLETRAAIFRYLAARFADGEAFKLEDLRNVAAVPLAAGLRRSIPAVKTTAIDYAHNMLRKQRSSGLVTSHPTLRCHYIMTQEPVL